jgi:hypothetical protein
VEAEDLEEGVEAEAADAAAAATAERTSLISWKKIKRESSREVLFLSSREVWKLIGKKNVNSL